MNTQMHICTGDHWRCKAGGNVVEILDILGGVLTLSYPVRFKIDLQTFLIDYEFVCRAADVPE